MARKSNKTAHVLNLLAGNDVKREEPKEETPKEETHTQENADAVSDAETPETPVVSEVSPTPVPAPTQSISVIDTDEPDPVAELIHNQLLDELNKELPEEMEDLHPVVDFESLMPPEDIVEPESATETETAITPEPESEPEPEFIRLNIIERIVEDKIIYFMRQFDVCTCDRCIADAIALTLNGLSPKYIVTVPSAIDPLLSFYTNKYISNITVEATKACIVIKENPRH